MNPSLSRVPERLARLRAAMQRHGVATVLVPSSDPHLSEYLPGRWQGRQWFSGFTGSMATLVVARDSAALFADSRYWTQAEAQLAGSGIALVKIPSAAAAHHLDWLRSTLAAGQHVAVDGDVLSLAAARQLDAALGSARIHLRSDLDLLAQAWPERPTLPAAPVVAHLPPHATQPRGERLAALREAMHGHGATHHLISTLDDIAWLFVLRGSDVEFNPVFLAHALVGPAQATLFVGAGKVSAALQGTLARDGIVLAAYDEAPAALAALPADAALLVDPQRITLGLRRRVPDSVRVIEAINPSTLAKSRKSAAEAAHIREAMAHDGAAMCEFYAWFEQALGRERITELTVDERLTAARARRPGFVGPSFATIAGFNANGAMPHYRATAEAHAVIEGHGLLLIDSGGQYLGCTTDITRVWPIGNITPQQRRDYTLVLRGMIALSRARFPRGTLSPMLDAIARAPLWQHGVDYGHGTGHGVGYFLNVHEGPQSLSKVMPEPQMAMAPGMVTSIEPGLYRPGRWGVRIENLVMNVPVETPEAGAFGAFLGFETLTLCPIDTRCIDQALLGDDDAAWLNAYHATVRERLSPLVDGAARAWLLQRTQAL